MGSQGNSSSRLPSCKIMLYTTHPPAQKFWANEDSAKNRGHRLKGFTEETLMKGFPIGGWEVLKEPCPCPNGDQPRDECEWGDLGVQRERMASQGPVRAEPVSATAKWLSARGSLIPWGHWQCLETFLVVKMLGRGDRYWYLEHTGQECH